MMEKKFEAKLIVGEKELPALLHVFRFQRDDMEFSFGRAIITGQCTANQLVTHGKLSDFRAIVDGYTTAWRLIFFKADTVWSGLESVLITHGDFYIMGCDESEQTD
jgi:hypothetical protein